MPKADWGAGASGAASGAITGATIGSAVPGIGTAVGAGIGGLLGGAGGLFGVGKKKRKKRSTFDKKQQQLYDLEHQALMGEGPLADLYNYDPEMANEVFDKTFARTAYRDLEERAIPAVTGQFRRQGLMNSSYAGDAIAKLARDVQEGLDAERAKYLYAEQKDARQAKRQAVENIQGRTTFDYDVAPNSSGFNIDSILSKLTPENIDMLSKLMK